MHHLAVTIDEPQAADVFAYREWIFVLTFRGHLLAYSTNDLIRQLQDQYGSDGAVASYGLFSSRGIGSAKTRAAWKLYDHTRSIDLRTALPPQAKASLRLNADAYLDFHVYYNKFYFATDRGTYRVRIDERRSLQDSADELEQLTRKFTESISVGLGAVASSLGDDGLLLHLGAEDERFHKSTLIDSYSQRSSIGYGLVANYPTNDTYELLKVDSAQHKGSKVITAISKEEDDLVAVESSSYVLWDSGRLLVADEFGITTRGKNLRSSPKKRLVPRKNDDVTLSMARTGNNALVTEFGERVEASRDGESALIYDGPVASVRAFSSSHRYRRLIAMTIEGGVKFSAVLSEYGDGEQ